MRMVRIVEERVTWRADIGRNSEGDKTRMTFRLHAIDVRKIFIESEGLVGA